MAAADLQLTEDELIRLDEVSRPRVGVYPYGPLAQEQRSRKLSGGR
jgi:aryl-alcohol dehydrogenase (NADP+)